MIEVPDARKAAADMQGLLGHPGWALLLEHLREQRESLRTELEARATAPLDRHAVAGEIRGLTTAINEPSRLIERWSKR